MSPGAVGTFGICRGCPGIAGATLEDSQGVSLRKSSNKGIIWGHYGLYRDNTGL